MVRRSWPWLEAQAQFGGGVENNTTGKQKTKYTNIWKIKENVHARALWRNGSYATGKYETSAILLILVK